MPISDEFSDFVVDQLSGWGDVSVRRMFGGAGLYCEGVMFGLIADDATTFLESTCVAGNQDTKVSLMNSTSDFTRCRNLSSSVAAIMSYCPI